MKFFTKVEDSWNAILKDISDAKSHVIIENFMWDSNEIGDEFTKVVLQKADENIIIEILIDYWGSKDFFFTENYKKIKNHQNIKLYIFNPLNKSWLLSPKKFFPRNHRKLFIIDNIKAHIGGVCIREEARKWRDTMTVINNKATINGLKQEFYSIQKRSEDTKNQDKLKSKPKYKIYYNNPDKNDFEFRDLLLKKIDNSTSSVKLTTPYFTSYNLLFPKLAEALDRGVKVEIILSNKTNFPTRLIGLKMAKELINLGADIYLFNNKMIHAKTMIIDNKWAYLGSCNLDGLSFYKNHELVIEIENDKNLKEINEHFLNDRIESVKLSSENINKFYGKFDSILAKLIFKFRKIL